MEAKAGRMAAMSQRVLSDKQRALLIEGDGKTATVMQPGEVNRVARLHHRGLVKILRSERPLPYTTTDKGRELCYA